MRPAGAVLAALLALGGPVAAQQIDFKRVTHRGDETLSYRWRDAARAEHAVSFTLTRAAIGEAEASFAEFSMEGMWRQLEAGLRDETRKFGNNARIELARNGDGLRWTAFAPDKRQSDRLMQLLAERFERDQTVYLSRYLRRRDGHRIMVDFAGATAALQSPMRAVAEALGKSAPGLNDDRARLTLALGFFQQIPYARLEDKDRRGGDFLPAPALLAQNRGDCDSKAVALAAVLRTYTPGRKFAVVTMPGHAILAVDLPSDPEDWAIRADGRQFVALEVAGPAMAGVGQVGAATARMLKEGREVEIWPLN